MSTGDLPAMSSSAHAHYAYDPGHSIGAAGMSSTGMDPAFAAGDAIRAGRRILGGIRPRPPFDLDNHTANTAEVLAHVQRKQEQPVNKERVVQIYVADLDPNLPLEKRLLWQSEPMFTDLADNDLWFDHAAVITERLAAHNKVRVTIRNKSIRDRDVMLEEIRPRDLSVNVTVLAQFQKQ